jgi:FKBP-type peptidyl-prolyl cis-trans isomerase SlpA
MPDKARIAQGSRVTLHFSLALEDDAVIDSNFDKPPATFVVGDGSLLPGFENALLNLTAGEKISVLLPAEQSFGASNPDNVQVLPRRKFAGLLANSTDPVVEGTVLTFTDTGGFEIPGVVKSIDEDTLVVDFNHPLSGRAIRFTAEIFSVIPAGVQVMEFKL